jgi:hypothetical protein
MYREMTASKAVQIDERGAWRNSWLSESLKLPERKVEKGELAFCFCQLCTVSLF